jgi:hypothetical protein
VIATIQRVEFIRKIHLFRGLKDEELNSIAEMMDEETFPAGSQVIRQGTEGNRFYIIYSGKVSVTRRDGSRQREVARLVEGDYFGEGALLTNRLRSATVGTEEETLLLSFSRDEFKELVKVVPNLRNKFEVSIASHRLERRANFNWLEDGEVIYFVNRRHPVELWRSLAGPVLSLIVPGFLLILYSLTLSKIPLYLGLGLLVAILLWILWRAIDWTNDYYIVTNRRVIWLEKIIGLYDSRQEAPLTAVLSVNTETDVTGRMLGFGDVVIRTFVGKITFMNVGSPAEVEMLVREHWERTKDSSRRANIDALKGSIRQKLGLVPPQPKQEAPRMAVKPLYKPGLLHVVAANLFKMRFEESGTITYRKHWFVLLKQTWIPGLLFLLTTVWLVYALFSGPIEVGTFETILFFFMFVFGLWWWYQYVDWSNDIFQVTADQIFDIDKKPLGRVEKNVAPLDNILSMDARREGVLQMLFNYGNVFITVGGSQMVFEDVMNPTAVQQDIDRRRVARRDKQEQDRIAAERDRLAEFFAMYHNNTDEFRREVEAHKQPPAKPDADEMK